jgi:curli biogenesis system outer membrane secretion channel CsgG
MEDKLKNTVIFLFTFLFSVGCVGATHYSQNMPHTEGPKAVTSIKTPYDELLTCLSRAYKGEKVSIGVGAVSDETGKFSIGDAGNGKYITQGAGDIVQSALLQTKIVRVVNRRDPRVMDMESQRGRKMQWIGSNYHITGSINSLDFLPGGGIEATVMGAGAGYRQHRMLVGMDLSLTNTGTSEVIAISSIFKQIVADEMKAGVGRFFGTTLVGIDLGQQNREAVHFATRNMLKLAVYELLSQLYDVKDNGCNALIENVQGVQEGNVVPVSISVDPF